MPVKIELIRSAHTKLTGLPTNPRAARGKGRTSVNRSARRCFVHRRVKNANYNLTFSRSVAACSLAKAQPQPRTLRFYGYEAKNSKRTLASAYVFALGKQ